MSFRIMHPPARCRDGVAKPFVVDSGELTPTLKVRRTAVAALHAGLIETLRRD